MPFSTSRFSLLQYFFHVLILIFLINLLQLVSFLLFLQSRSIRLPIPALVNLNRRSIFCVIIMVNYSEINLESYIYFEEFRVLTMFIYHVWLCIVIFGLVSNTINIVVFAKIGFRDNVTVTLLFLSLSDLLNLILNCPVVVARFMGKNFPYHVWPFHPKILFFGMFWWAYIFYDYSSFVSVFLALVRCACVSRPLRFKSMFTISRTVTILSVLFLVAVTLRVPVLTVFRLSWEVNPVTNSTSDPLSLRKISKKSTKLTISLI